MQTWSVQDAKARFSEFLGACVEEGPQLVTKRGNKTAVLIPIEEWKRLKESAKPSLKSLLLTDISRGDLAIPKRGAAKRRSIPQL